MITVIIVIIIVASKFLGICYLLGITFIYILFNAPDSQMK